ncbi:MAG TPA: hypothetical protein VMR62_07645 [Bryobacteraceae bacterium]|jgi:hypothetical protein|nr:hypothetical protein [Bryobacteraceae bacterium]
MDRLYEVEKQAGKTHRRFRRMLNELGPVETANRLIDKKNTEGLRELQTHGLLEIGEIRSYPRSHQRIGSKKLSDSPKPLVSS